MNEGKMKLNGYKLVDNDLCSFSMVGDNKIKYIPDNYVKPKIDDGPLAVFDTLDHALFFISQFDDNSYQIWKCEYIPSSERMLWCTYFGSLTKDKRTLVLKGCYCPSGTMFADQVKLLERVV